MSAAFEPMTFDTEPLPRTRLLQALSGADIHLNDSAERLLADVAFGRQEPLSLTVVERSVGELGLTSGAVLADVFEAALERGLRLCPPTLGPYLRLAWRTQRTAPDAVMSNGQAPSGSLTVASAPLRSDAGYPRGFYLRVIDDQLWLRGYRCSDEYMWCPSDSFAFALPDAETVVAPR